MYIRGLIPKNFAALDEAVPIGLVDVHWFFLTVARVGLQCLIVVFHTHLLSVLSCLNPLSNINDVLNCVCTLFALISNNMNPYLTDPSYGAV